MTVENFDQQYGREKPYFEYWFGGANTKEDADVAAQHASENHHAAS